jgi:hypothetical protein
MYTTHTLLDTLFNGSADTVDTTVTMGVDDARTFLSGGHTFVLPTQAELVALSNTYPTTGWYNTRYWSSTLVSTDNHTAVGIAGDWTYTEADSTPEMLVLQVLPVVIDLNRDGILSYGQVTMDVNGDGVLDVTKWAGAQDGVLVWDKFADGLVHDNSQYAFAQYATTYANGLDAQGKVPTDLSGLAEAFDSNHDGMFDAQDAKFAEFKVWQDVNQNGVSDAGEVRSLADWGITSINLTSDGVVRTPVAGVTEAGQTTASSADGSSILVADAAFAYSSVAYSMSNASGDAAQGASAGNETTSMTLNLLGANMNLDLSSFVAQHGAIDAVDMSGTGANTLKINLSDVLQGTLQVNGDANDTVVLNTADWTDSGKQLLQNGHQYEVYNANEHLNAQLLIEQHMGVQNV